jgi:predicted Ser/Thr protein kinase
VLTTPPAEPEVAGATFAIPTIEELAAHFPHLEIVKLLGRGGMGAVYQARQQKLDRLVALKVLPAEWSRDPAFAERFAREAKALARLNHPHIVAVHDFGEAGGHFYLVMEYVEGANLRQLLQDGPLQPVLALQIIPQICDALQYAHEEGVVHRDIKPENILLDRRGRVKIADFGLAKLVGPSRASFTLTGTHQVMGTFDYMAPEQRLRPQDVDHRADIYSLGVVLYEMLTGELPLGRFAAPSQAAGVDDRLDEVVFRALEREPARRFQRISEVRTAVEAIAPGTRSVKGMAAWGLDLVPEWVQLQVKGPAIGLIAAAVIALIFWLVMGVAGVATFLDEVDRSRYHPRGYFSPGDYFIIAMVAFFGPFLVVYGAATMITGANRLRHFTSYELVIVAVILAMLPWSPHVILGVPVGIWCLWTLSRREVSAAFAAGLRGQREAASPPPEPPQPLQPTNPVLRKARSFLHAFRTLFFSSPKARAFPSTTGPAPADAGPRG